MTDNLPNSQGSQSSTFSDLWTNVNPSQLDSQIEMPSFSELSIPTISGEDVSSTQCPPNCNHSEISYTENSSANVSVIPQQPLFNQLLSTSTTVTTTGQAPLNLQRHRDEMTYRQESQQHVFEGNGAYPTSYGQHQSTCNYSANTVHHSLGPQQYNGMTHSPDSTSANRSTFTPPTVNDFSHVSSPGNYPCLESYPGDYNFEISFGQRTESAQKSALYTYSHALDKLYVKMNTLHPVYFKTSKPLPVNTVLRAMPVYTKPDNFAENVTRCPNHLIKDPATDHPSKKHLIRVDTSQPHIMQNVRYETSNTGRESVVIKFPTPEIGSDHTTILFKYMCLSSCVGGINRRPISTIFSLERNGQVIGRQSVEVRICSCPGRDRSQDEKKVSKPGSIAIPLPKKRKSEASTSRQTANGDAAISTNENGEEEFLLYIKGREKYEFLKKIKEGLDFMELFDASQMSQYRTQQNQTQNQKMREILQKFFKQDEDRHDDEKKPFPTKSSRF